MERTNPQIKFKMVFRCIISNYQSQVEVFQSFSNNNNAKNRFKEDTLWATVDYLHWDLMDLKVKIHKVLDSNLSCKEKSILENYERDLYNMSILLGKSHYLGNECLIDNVITTEYILSKSIIVLLEHILFGDGEVDDFDYKLLSIVHETGYALQKFMIFTLAHLNVEESFNKYKQLSKEVVVRLKATLLEFKDEIIEDKFIYYTKRSLQFLYKYLIYAANIFETGNLSAKVKQLLYIASNYAKFHISILSNAINAENPINNMLSVLDELECQHLASLEEIINMVESSSTADEIEVKGLIHHAALFFTETIQNIISIEEVGKGLRYSNK